VNDALIPPNIIPVNDNPPTLSEAGLDNLCNVVARGFTSIKLARAQTDIAIALLEKAVGIVGATNLQETDLGADLEDVVVVLRIRALEALADAQGILESTCAANEAISAAGDIEDDDDDVAGYLAIDPSTPDRVIDEFIAAVGADRVLVALDRLTAPAN
jgi:hypothetical protein